MKLALRLPDPGVADGEFCSPAAIAALAGAAEKAGFDAIYTPDHPAPASDEDGRPVHHAYEPFTVLSFAAATTQTLRLLTFVIVLPYRNPFLTAKAAATLDMLSEGRFVLGVGTGYMEAEFRALGVDFEARNDLADDALVAIKAAWTGKPVHHVGHGFVADGNVLYPPPTQQPHPPIWCGGNTHRAIERALKYGQAWLPVATAAPQAAMVRTSMLDTAAALSKRIQWLHNRAEELERREPLDIAFMPLGAEAYLGVPTPQRFLDAAGELAEIGVTYALTQFPVASMAEMLDCIERYGSEVIPELSRVS